MSPCHPVTKSSPRRAFSLLEVLLALAVLGVGLAALSFIFGATARSAGRTRIQTDLHLLAQMRMSQIEAGEINPDQFTGGDSPFDRKPDFVWRCEINDDWEPTGRLRQVSVVVKYDGPDGVGELTLSRLICLRDEPRAANDATITTWLPGAPVPTVAPPSAPKTDKGKTGGAGGTGGTGGTGTGGGGGAVPMVP